MDRVSQIMAYEAGELDEDQVIEMFQSMINDGTVWQLQGAYGRAATQLIDQGLCTRPEPKPQEVGKSEVVGPYHKVSADKIVDHGEHGKFRVLLYGAYNACGIIGSEFNGVAVLSETNTDVVCDNLARISSGYFGASDAQKQFFEDLCAADWTSFRKLVNSSDRCRYQI